MIEEPKSPKYTKFLAALKDIDPEVYDYVLHNVRSVDYEPMMERLERDCPDLEAKLKAALETTKPDPPRRGVAETDRSPLPERGREALREVFDNMRREYTCRGGFRGAEPEKKGVTIRMRGDVPIIGLPRGLVETQNRILKDIGAKRQWTFSFDNRAFTAELSDDEIEELRKDPSVESVTIEPIASILVAGRYPIPPYNPAIENVDWGVERILTSVPWGKDIKGQGIKLAVVDTGIDTSHQDLQGRYSGGWDFVSGDNNPADDHDHGTFCCGIAAGAENGSGYMGVAPQVELYAVKVLNAKGQGSLAVVAGGIDWCVVNGMDVISLSLGASSGGQSLQDACNNAWIQGCVVVAAAGNSGPGMDTVNYPGAYTSVIAVAAIDYNEAVASYSSRGPEVELAAPGSWICGPWAGHTYTDYVIDNSDKYIVASGTSAACPHVAGAAALIKCWYPAATNTQIRQWLRDHATDI